MGALEARLSLESPPQYTPARASIRRNSEGGDISPREPLPSLTVPSSPFPFPPPIPRTPPPAYPSESQWSLPLPFPPPAYHTAISRVSSPASTITVSHSRFYPITHPLRCLRKRIWSITDAEKRRAMMYLVGFGCFLALTAVVYPITLVAISSRASPRVLAGVHELFHILLIIFMVFTLLALVFYMVARVVVMLKAGASGSQGSTPPQMWYDVYYY
ncbi:hypothetical protein VTI74DRAFT_7162 [Chaetomium olivicolor]